MRDLAPLMIARRARRRPLWAPARGSAGAGGGIVYNAISGIEAAIWDLAASRSGFRSLLFGGRSATPCACTPTAMRARRCTRWTRRWSLGGCRGDRPTEAVPAGPEEHGRPRRRAGRGLHAGAVRGEGAQVVRPRLHGSEVRSRRADACTRTRRGDDLRRGDQVHGRPGRGDGRGRRGSGRRRVRLHWRYQVDARGSPARSSGWG